MSKAVPIRMCVVCRSRHLKKDLRRHVVRVRENGEVFLSEEEGRGYYHCLNEQCGRKFLLFRWIKKQKRVKDESRNN